MRRALLLSLALPLMVAGKAAAQTCVGMPSFTQDTPPGYPVMTRQQAETLADYLLSLK